MMLLDKKGAAELLQVSTISIDRFRKDGLLPFRQLGSLVRFTQEDIDVFLKRTLTEDVRRYNEVQ
ncbi:MAG: helix-turn-helix domain-containing protein [Treponema sp.]|jgi:excisionase family DNA binding protein|nr:helix-turn-helix domain-containing protein [Treponema sp.]